MRNLLTLWRENERLRQERDEFARAIVEVGKVEVEFTEPGAIASYEPCPWCASESEIHKPDCIVLKADAIKKQMEDEK